MRRALEGLAGVNVAYVDLASGVATVEVSGQVSGEELVRAAEGKVILSWARDILARARRRER